MKKKSTLLYIIIAGALLLGAGLGILIYVLTGHTIVELFSNKWAFTIYIAIGTFITICGVLLLLEWGRK